MPWWREHAAALAILPLFMLTLGCGDDVKGVTPDPVELPPPQVGAFPLGTFEATIEAADVLPIFATLVGTGQYTFNADASFHFELTDASTGAVKFTIDGYISVSGNAVSFVDQVGGSCQSTVGDYTWSFDGTALTFTYVRDLCDGRATGVTTKPFIKQ